MRMEIKQRHDELSDQKIDADKVEIEFVDEGNDTSRITVEHDLVQGEVRILVVEAGGEAECVWSKVGVE